jgi:hypothetical protein
MPVHSFQTLLQDLRTIALNTVQSKRLVNRSSRCTGWRCILLS